MFPFRNQVIPMEVRERTALDTILDRVESFLRLDNKNPALSLEIEGKLGTFELKKQSQIEFYQILEQFSSQNFILLDNDTQNNYKLEKTFNSCVEPKPFQNLLDYFRRVYEFSKYFTPTPEDNDFNREYFAHMKNRQTRESISVDYIVGNIGDKKQRLTYELGNGLSYLEKQNKVHFDLLHNSKPMRVSINYEEKKDWKDYVNLLGNTKNIRVKHRTVFPYQFFEYHMTEVITINENSPEFNEFKSALNFNTEAFDLKLINLFGGVKNINYEIELEISDLIFLRQFLAQKEAFKSIFLRFLRNLESLYYGGNPMEEIAYNRYIGAAGNVEKPIFGDYMMKEALENEKRRCKSIKK